MITLARILFSFVSQIKDANLSRKCLVSYNVTSLFPNIPLQETIDIAINLIFNHNPNLNITNSHTSNRKKMDLYRNFKSFTLFSYMISLIKCLIDRSFKMCNNWNSFIMGLWVIWPPVPVSHEISFLKLNII